MANACFCNSSSNNLSISDVDGGKTVKGDYSNQKFSYDYIGELESSETVVRLKVVGFKSKDENRRAEVEQKIDELQSQLNKLRLEL
jgi:uncharacterized protein YutD